MKKLLLAAAAALTLTAGSAGAEEILDFTSLIRAVPNPSGTAMYPRVIVPFFNKTEDTSGNPTKLTFRFNVWDPTTNTQLFGTTNKSVAYPAMPCANPQWTDHGMSVKFMGRWGGGRAHAIIGLHVECQEQTTYEWQERNVAFVYSADVRQAGGSVWTKAYTGYLVAANGLDLEDANGTLGIQDGINETLMLSVENPKGLRVLLLNFTDGQLFSNPAVTMPSDKVFGIGNP